MGCEIDAIQCYGVGYPKLQTRWNGYLGINATKCTAIVVETLLYGVEVWGGTSSLSAWSEIDKILNIFLILT